MRKLVLAAAIAIAASTAAPREARADIGIGLFVGEPVGFDLKVGLGPRTALDILIGATSFRDGSDSYGHVTYLITPVVGRGSSVLVPLRLGIGAALYGAIEDNTGFGVRAPLELGFRFRRNPLELYFEIAARVNLVGRGGPYFAIDGGGGLRVYF